MKNQSQNIEINETVLMAYIISELPVSQMEIVDRWIKESPEHKKEFENVKKAWEVIGQLDPKPISVNTEKAWQKVQSEINLDETITISKKQKSIFPTVLAIAASLTLLAMAYFFWQKPLANMDLLATNTIVEKTFSDGSSITLDKESQISYPESFGKKERRVTLKGKAFFDIARDTSLPFIIDLPDNFYVRVLGTSFTINTDDEGSTTVFVKSGTVEFGNASEKLILTANEKAIFNNNSKTFEKIVADIKNSEELYWINEQLVFEGEQLSDIISVLSSIFEVEIKLLCHKAAAYPIVSNHQHEDLESILEVVCLVHDLSLTKHMDKGKVSYSITCND